MCNQCVTSVSVCNQCDAAIDALSASILRQFELLPFGLLACNPPVFFSDRFFLSPAHMRERKKTGSTGKFQHTFGTTIYSIRHENQVCWVGDMHAAYTHRSFQVSACAFLLARASEKARERMREQKKARARVSYRYLCMCECMYVRERAREKARDT